MEIDEIIQKLKELDLAIFPESEIRELLNKIGTMASIKVTLHAGKSIMRARPNYNGERFEKKTDYSFKPEEYNTTYQRASTPYQTMFYATFISDKIEEGELDNARLIAVAETIPLLRDKEASGYQKISFGRWYVKEDIHLISVVHKDSYYKESSYTRELVEAFKKVSETVDPILVEKSLKIQTFIADEFAKEIRDNYDYMISAIFTETLLQKFDGVFYPSVRAGGKGFNVAINPASMNKLELQVAGECSLYKHKDHSYVSNDAIVELYGSEEEFNLINNEKQEEYILAKLGVSSVDELTQK